MKQFVIAGTLAGALAVGGTALAQTPASRPHRHRRESAEATPAEQAEKPAAHAPEGPAATTQAGHTAPKAQPNTAEEPTAPGAMALGTVRLPKGVKADGKEIAAGSYQVRLTADEAKPDAKGSSEKLERWVEFVKGGRSSAARSSRSCRPAEAKLVQKDTPPAVRRLEGRDPQGRRLRPRLDQQGRQLLPGPPAQQLARLSGLGAWANGACYAGLQGSDCSALTREQASRPR